MKLNLSDVPTCAKRGCSSTHVHRHHRGCEAMWIRHFAHKSRTKRYKVFVQFYEQFRSKDCVPLCPEHHLALHKVYYQIIGSWVRRARLPCRDWTWSQAHSLMAHLRKTCDQWIKQDSTPHPSP